MVAADLHKASMLVPAFQGANVIFSVTDFWKPFFDPKNIERAKREGISIGEMAYKLEYEQGKNICDAAAHPDVLCGLDNTGFIPSTLTSAKEASKGQYKELYHFESKAEIFPKYLEQNYPELAKKTSYLQTGYFMLSWHYMPHKWPGKQPDGTFVFKATTDPDTVLPHLDVQTDTGYYVKALVQMPPGQMVMAAGDWCSWSEWMKKWARGMGIDESKASYKQISAEEMGADMGDFGKEVGEMYEYSSKIGYFGGLDMLKGEDLRKQGYHIPMTTVEEYTKKEDWTAALNVC